MSGEARGYAVDSSALLQLDGVEASPRFPSYTSSRRDEVWALMERATKQGRLWTVGFVVAELERHGPGTAIKVKAIPGLVRKTVAGLVRLVAEIQAEFPDLVHEEDAESEPADPWVIALARREKGTVVANEFRTNLRRKPGAPRIPDVCKHYGLRCLTIDELIRELEPT